jgi:flagellar basal body rod protein FlgB
VDLDREMTELSKNGLQYIALVQYLNQKLRTLRSAITDGGRI